MGISYHPVAKFGIRFKKDQDVRDFLSAQHEYKFNEDDHLREQIPLFFESLELTPLDMFNTQESILGYPIKLGDTLDKYQAMWDKEFPNAVSKPEPILAVRTW